MVLPSPVGESVAANPLPRPSPSDAFASNQGDGPFYGLRPKAINTVGAALLVKLCYRIFIAYLSDNYFS